VHTSSPIEEQVLICTRRISEYHKSVADKPRDYCTFYSDIYTASYYIPAEERLFLAAFSKRYYRNFEYITRPLVHLLELLLTAHISPTRKTDLLINHTSRWVSEKRI
jgi:hypothetical protein